MPDTWQLSALTSLAACPPHGAGPRLTCRRPPGRAMLPPGLPPSLGPGRAGPLGGTTGAEGRALPGGAPGPGSGTAVAPPAAGERAFSLPSPGQPPSRRPCRNADRHGARPACAGALCCLILFVCTVTLRWHCRSHTPLRDVHMNLACTEITTPS